MTLPDPPLWPRAIPPAELDVVGVGESSLDTVCIADGPPDFGGKQDLVEYARFPGGQIASTVLACVRLGLRGGLVGSVGDDEDGRVALGPLRDAGVDLRGVRVVPGVPTRLAIVLVSRLTGERAVLGYRDRRLALAPAQVEPGEILRARALHLDATDPELSEWAGRTARGEGRPVVLDADRRWPHQERLLSQVDFPVVSRRLAEELGGTGSVRDGLRAMLGHGARLAVATLGEFGALALSRERAWESPGFPAKVADQTGAGDAFHGGFVWALLRGLGVSAALRAANALGALNCEAIGAQGGLPTLSELERFLRSRSPEPWRDPGVQAER